jgi:hypothetical protein
VQPPSMSVAKAKRKGQRKFWSATEYVSNNGRDSDHGAYGLDDDGFCDRNTLVASAGECLLSSAVSTVPIFAAAGEFNIASWLHSVCTILISPLT